MAKSLTEYQEENRPTPEVIPPYLFQIANDIEKIVDGSRLQQTYELKKEDRYFVLITRDNYPELIAQLEPLTEQDLEKIAQVLTKRYNKKDWAEIWLTKDEKGWRKKTLIQLIVWLNKHKFQNQLEPHGLEGYPF